MSLLREVRSPANGEVVGQYPENTFEDLDLALERAQAAFKAWSGMTAYDREGAMRKASALARGKAPEIGRLMALEQGKPLKQSVSEVSASCDILDFYAAEGVRVAGQILQTEKTEFLSLVSHAPLGIAALITPWNYPVALLSWKLGPALAAGCAALLKPSPLTSLCSRAFVEALQPALPDGLLAVLTSQGPELGAALVGHPKISKIAMTGSTATGKAIMKAEGASLKRITLELGGHCPALVLEDADLDQAAEAIAYKAFRNMGQSCSSINRVYAHHKIHAALVEKVAANAAKMTIGDGIKDGSVDLGPMSSAEGLAKVKRHVADALAKGARLVYGGKAPEGADFAKGNYYLPTVLTGLKPDMLMAREETFGPVAPFAEFDDLDQAVHLANDSAYGLVSYVFTRDTGLAFKLSQRLEAGTVCVNHVQVNTAYGPYQGWKDSGLGLELSREAIFEYMKIKHLKLKA
jgi:acyl-CoA reductase-like NAD-dependent aldehyde dehydrogenase